MGFLLYVLIGSVAGSISGLLGLGGGIVVVPLLASLFEQQGFPHIMVMQFAAGTSLAVMIVTTSASFRAHIKLSERIWPLVKQLLPGMMLGVIVGAIFADILHSQVLRMIFGVMLVFNAINALIERKPREAHQLPSKWMMGLSGLGMGTMSGMLGIGGGAFIVPFLLFFGIDMRIAVAVSTGSGLVSAVVGTISYMITGANEIHHLHWTTGYIYWPAFLGVALASPVFATLGAHYSYKVPVVLLRRIFVAFLLVVAIKLLAF